MLSETFIDISLRNIQRWTFLYSDSIGLHVRYSLDLVLLQLNGLERTRPILQDLVRYWTTPHLNVYPLHLKFLSSFFFLFIPSNHTMVSKVIFSILTLLVYVPIYAYLLKGIN